MLFILDVIGRIIPVDGRQSSWLIKSMIKESNYRVYREGEFRLDTLCLLHNSSNDAGSSIYKFMFSLNLP